jgi:hypothetical protein
MLTEIVERHGRTFLFLSDEEVQQNLRFMPALGIFRVITGCERGPGPKARLANCRNGYAKCGGRTTTSCCPGVLCCGLWDMFHVDVMPVSAPCRVRIAQQVRVFQYRSLPPDHRQPIHCLGYSI